MFVDSIVFLSLFAVFRGRQTSIELLTVRLAARAWS